jgi:hypothetical protein
MDLASAIPIGDGLELQLGKEVRLAVTPAKEALGARIVLAGTTYLAPLGPALISLRPGAGPNGAWRIEIARDGWLELVSTGAHPAYLRDVELDARSTLLVGDEISAERSGPAVLRILGREV